MSIIDSRTDSRTESRTESRTAHKVALNGGKPLLLFFYLLNYLFHFFCCHSLPLAFFCSLPMLNFSTPFIMSIHRIKPSACPNLSSALFFAFYLLLSAFCFLLSAFCFLLLVSISFSRSIPFCSRRSKMEGGEEERKGNESKEIICRERR